MAHFTVRGLLGILLLVAVAAQAAERPKVALVLSGGGARGLAHVGVLKELDRQRVPYDCVVGTSMGAIAGGAIATGLPIALAEEKVVNADWDAIFADKASRKDIPYFRKEDDWKAYFDFNVPFQGMKLYTSRNFMGVQNISLFFRELTGSKFSANFDDLPVPYRAVGTDIVSGEPVIIDEGTVATAMRASMSIPGVFPPIKYKEHLLVDGGLSNNIPVNVGRELCGDVVIVVNVSTPVFEEDQLNSFFNIGMQVISIAMQRGMDEQLKNIRAQDVLIVPELDGYSSVDFKKVKDLIALGEKATQKVENELSRYSVSEEEYTSWQKSISERKAPPPVVSEITVESTRWVNPLVLEGLLDVRLGQPFDSEALHKNIDGVFARGDFTSISYDLNPLPDGTASLALVPSEKPARDFLRFGLKLESDFDSASDFGVLASLRRVWLNQLDAEWTTEAEIGSDIRFLSEWYQPLAINSEIFIAPNVKYGREFRDVVINQRAVAEYEVETYSGGIEVGSTIGRFGQIRAGIEKGNAKLNPEKGISYGSVDEERSGFTISAIYDQIDNPQFPYEGGSVHFKGFIANTELGSADNWSRLELDARRAFTLDKNSVLLTTRLGYSVNTNAPAYEMFYLGGLFNLSAYRKWSLFDTNMAYASAQFYRRVATLPNFVGKGFYVGFIGEAGSALSNQDVKELSLGDVKYSGGMYLAADTRLGPLYLSANAGSDDQKAVYIAIGARY